ncbi:hypothetical protein sce6812 [Sorangium cellulosum So ce56]|uniref:DUF790 family protein n=1 Tax=Sorangium cellulosum (strain So ce56) TaxID=448385 RepID=A9GTR0_SORC5|nr:DUF790 family protein [Sorangium cellulosum]CAN96981.1 hypothetical protein sce6812 [Sorangium cellulosum So ce56]
MLTSDLVRVRRRGGLVVPQYLRGAAAERLLPVARAYIDILSQRVGERRDEVEAALDAIEVPARDRVASLGLRKVLEDGCEYEVQEGVDPEALRRELFHAAAAAHRALDVRARFDRAAVLDEVAARLGTTPAAIEAGLYADLRGAEILRRAAADAPEILLDRYNLALAQSILLRATQVTIRIEGESAQRYRRIFRAARFHGLIHVVQGDPVSGYTIALDGPFSLFDAVQRYGLRLAMFLPSVLSCASFRLRADLRWGRDKEPLAVEIGPADGLLYHGRELAETTPELDAFCEGFRKLGSPWTVSPNERLFALPGEVVCVPDLVFLNAETGEEVYLEAFGFWSRDAVWRRVELIRKGFPARILLAVGRQLRVSEEVLGDDEAGEIYVYRATMSPRAVLARLDGKRGGA